MGEECSHDCSNCSKKCSNPTGEGGNPFAAALHAGSRVGKVIAVSSGKGGVGKSFVTTMLAVEAARAGKRVAILDADVTGPSIPRAFGLPTGAYQGPDGIEPPVTPLLGIRVMSLNLLVENPEDPVVWRGPVIAGAVKQFWSDVHWDDIDIMFVDMPPGTGDVPLTVYQSLPVDGVVIVASPQELVGMIVEKSIRMAEMMKKPVTGLVENMSWFECPDCGKRHFIFGESRIDALAEKHGIRNVAKLPVNPDFAQAIDQGKAEALHLPELAGIIA